MSCCGHKRRALAQPRPQAPVSTGGSAGPARAAAPAGTSGGGTPGPSAAAPAPFLAMPGNAARLALGRALAESRRWRGH